MSETQLDPGRTLGELVADQPRYASVFESYGIDYCCGGDVTLEQACENESVTVDQLREALREVEDDAETDHGDWECPSELIDHIVETHHDYLRSELSDLESLVETVSQVHGEKHPELREVAEIVPELAAEMRTHITEEEEAGFPVIRKLDDGVELSPEEISTLQEEIDGFEDDHQATADRLDRIAELTNDYEVPDDACPSYQSMLARLEDLERDTHMHVHKENNVLFPEAEAMLESAN